MTHITARTCPIHDRDTGVTAFYLVIKYFKVPAYQILAYVNSGGRMSLEHFGYQFISANMIFNMEIHPRCIKDDIASWAT